MHMRMLPSFFLTNSTGAPYGDLLGLAIPCLLRSANVFFIHSLVGQGVGRLGWRMGAWDELCGWEPGMTWSTSLLGGRDDGKSLGNTSENSVRMTFADSDCG